MELSSRLERHADLAVQIISHQIQCDYIAFFKKHVMPAVRRIAGQTLPRVNLREHSLILALSQIPSGQSGVQLAFLIRSDPATVSRNITKLCEKGLAVAQSDPDDSRAMIYTLTERGWDLANLYREQWREAVSRADTVIGALGEMEFRDQLMTFYALKDRARAHADWRPGKPNAFERGMGRPDPHVRPDLGAVRLDVDSFFRFFGQQISADYLSCITHQLAKPVLRDMRGEAKPLSLTDLRTMMCLDFYDHAMSGAEIARAMRFDPATVARSVAALEEGGFVSTRMSDFDRRRSETSTTQKGRELSRTYRRHADEMEDRMTADFGIVWQESARKKSLAHLLATRDRAAKLAALRRLPA